MKYRKKGKRAKKRSIEISDLLHGGSSSDFFKYGSIVDDLLDDDEIEGIGYGAKGENGKTDGEGSGGESDRNHFNKHSIYSKHDTYKDDMDQYDLNAMDILMDTTHHTSQNWKSNIDIHTQDPHLRRLILKEKSL